MCALAIPLKTNMKPHLSDKTVTPHLSDKTVTFEMTLDLNIISYNLLIKK